METQHEVYKEQLEEILDHLKQMQINDFKGTMNLDDDAIPSIDDMNDIIGSVTKSGEEFQALCDASCDFPKSLTNREFLKACEAWLESLNK